MKIIDFNKINKECVRINGRFNFDEIMELIRDLSIIGRIKHKKVLQHQIKELNKLKEKKEDDN